MRLLLALPLVFATAACGADEPAVRVDDPGMTPAMETAGPARVSPAAESRNIVAVAADAGTFTTLLAAVEAAGLAPVLQGEGPFTLFAPTDAAFEKLPAGTVEALLADRERLTAILTYHVVPGRVTSEEIVRAGGATPATVQGETLTVEVRGSSVTVDGATVTAADVEASNGVIHVIDSVVLPEAAN